jgi:ABC-type antimicrobial peptide transport system permease subunit
MNGYQKIVLFFGAVSLLIILIPSVDIAHSAFPMNTLFIALGIMVAICLFFYAFKDLDKKKNKRKKK